MKTSGKQAALLIAGAVCAGLLFMTSRRGAAGQQAPPTGLSEAGKQIWKLENEDEEAERMYDTSVLERHMSADIVLVLGSGKRWTKERYLGEINLWKAKRDANRAAGKPEEPELPAKLEDVAIKEFGQTVIFSCLAQFPYKDEQGKLRNRSYRDVDVWTKVNGEWKQIAASATSVYAPIETTAR